MHIAMLTGHDTRPGDESTAAAAASGVVVDEQVALLAAALGKRGHTVTVYVPVESEQARVVGEELAAGVDVEPIAVGAAGDPRMPDRYGERIEHDWRRRPPDVAHAVSWSAGLAAISAAGEAVVPLVQDYRPTTRRRPDGRGAGKVLRLETALGQRAHRNLVAGTDHAAVLARHGVPGDRISVVPYGVDVETFGRDGPAAPRSDRPRLVYADGVTAGASSEPMVRALPRIPDAELLIVDRDAADEDPRSGELLEVAEDLGVADRVRFLGGLAAHERAALFRSADLAVNVSAESVGAARCVEAMACETPVVAVRLGWTDGLVIDGISGVVAPSEDPPVLARRVRDLLDDKRRRLAYGIAAADRATACYSFDRVAAHADAAYTSAVQAGHYTGSSLAGTYHPTKLS